MIYIGFGTMHSFSFRCPLKVLELIPIDKRGLLYNQYLQTPLPCIPTSSPTVLDGNRILFPYPSKPKHHGHTREVNIMNNPPPLLSVWLVNLLHTSLRNRNKENRTSLIFPPQFYQPTYICIHTSPFLSIIINEVSLLLPKSYLPTCALNPIVPLLKTVAEFHFPKYSLSLPCHPTLALYRTINYQNVNML